MHLLTILFIFLLSSCGTWIVDTNDKETILRAAGGYQCTDYEKYEIIEKLLLEVLHDPDSYQYADHTAETITYGNQKDWVKITIKYRARTVAGGLKLGYAESVISPFCTNANKIYDPTNL